MNASFPHTNIVFRVVYFFIIISFSSAAAAQEKGEPQSNGSRSSNIITAVPFLLINPDARTGSMGEAGVAVDPDVNATSGNAAKLPFINHRYGFSVSYSPWLKSFVADINLAYLSGFYQLANNQTIATSLRYFSIGQVQLKDNTQQDLGVYNPNELAFDVGYAKAFGSEFSMATTLRFIYSNLVSGQFAANQDPKAGKSFAVDVAAYYRKPTIMFNKDAVFSFGTTLTNIGAKLSYANGGEKYFLPANLKLGMATRLLVDDFNEFTFALDFNKLLVPTQPLRDAEGNIIAGKNPNVSLPEGIFGSFNDAPGGGKEELKEISIATGLEYKYHNQFALRAGYFYEAPEKGDRRYFTLGAGLKYRTMNLDVSYLLADARKNPLANTLRFTLLFNFEQIVN